MNLGQAVAVCLYQLTREANAPVNTEKQPNATAAELDRLSAMLLEALDISGYVKPSAPGPMEEKIRRLVRRLNFSAEDSETCLGMLRQMLWKMRTKY